MSAGNKKRLEDALEAGRKMVSADDHSIRGEELRLENLRQTKVGEDNGVFSCQMNRDGTQAVVGLGSGSIQLYSLEKLERIRKMHPGSFISLPITSVKYYPTPTKNLVFVASADASISVWDLDTLRRTDTIDETGNQISAMDFCIDGSCFATAGKDKNVRVYDSDTLKIRRLFHGLNLLDVESDEKFANESGHCQKVLALRFHPDDKDVFLTGGWDHSLKIWDMRADCVVRTIRDLFVCGDSIDVLGNEILTGSWIAHNSLQIWDYGSGKLIEQVPFPVSNREGELLYCARFLDSRTVIAGGSGTNDLKIIDRKSKKVIHRIDGDNHAVQALDVNQRSNTILLGTSGNLLKSATVIEVSS